MPLYEYYCEPCNGVFELLRPAREAADPQPCPQCDEDAKRVMSKEWSAFIFREGFPRRLPDTGGYWVDGKISKTPKTVEKAYVPEDLRKAPTAEEIERYETERDAYREKQRLMPGLHDLDYEKREAAFRKRMLSKTGSDVSEKYKRRIVEKDTGEVLSKLRQAELKGPTVKKSSRKKS